MAKEQKFDKSIFKMSPEELQIWLHYRKAHSCIDNKKGKGSYKRKPKHPNRDD
jgi:hypothetical protein